MFNLIRNLLLLIFGVIVIGTGIVFNYHNQQQISIDLLFFTLPELTSGVVIIGNLFIGFLLAIMVGLVHRTRMRIRNGILSRRVDRLQQDLDKVRKERKLEKVDFASSRQGTEVTVHADAGPSSNVPAASNK